MWNRNDTIFLLSGLVCLAVIIVAGVVITAPKGPEKCAPGIYEGHPVRYCGYELKVSPVLTPCTLMSPVRLSPVPLGRLPTAMATVGSA